MGRVLEGQWIDHDLGPDEQGRYVRREAQFRGTLSADGSSGFPAEADRYHLFASKACGWTHRVLLVRALRGLEHAVSVSWAEAHMGASGWTFVDEPELGVDHAWQVYVRAQADYTGRASVPILWDRERQTVVTNESTDLVLGFDREFDGVATEPTRLWPVDQHDAIAAMIQASYGPLNNGVYRAGFAGSQEAHAEASRAIHQRLCELDALLADRPWLMGDRFTAADVCLFPTIYRFDAVYHTHFKANLSRVADHPNLWDWARATYQLPGVAPTCDLEHAKRHYYTSHESIHPRAYVPLGPLQDWTAPHSRPSTWIGA